MPKITLVSLLICFLFHALAYAVKPASVEKLLPAGKVHEECVQMQAAQSLRYSFQADATLDFNVHYHVGKDVFYPVKQAGTQSKTDVFKPTIAQHYCLMWTNTASKEAKLKYEFLVE